MNMDSIVSRESLFRRLWSINQRDRILKGRLWVYAKHTSRHRYSKRKRILNGRLKMRDRALENLRLLKSSRNGLWSPSRVLRRVKKSSLCI